MLRKGFIKPILTVDGIGRTRFWVGILVGLIFSFLFSYLFNYYREGFRSITITGDLYLLSEQDFRLYDLFYAFFATSLGLGFTILTWFYGRNKPKIRRHYLRFYAISSIYLVTFIFLGGVTRFASIFPLVFYTVWGYDNQIDLIHIFWLLFVLIPLVLFFLQWNTIRLLVRTKHWISFSFILFLIISFYLYQTSAMDRNILKVALYNENKEKFDYIDGEFHRAKEYGIYFSETTREILQKHYAERTTLLVEDVKSAFATKNRVSIDTLILQKILIHNLHRRAIYYWEKDEMEKNWAFALPEQVYEQIKMYPDINSPEVKILFEILHEQKQILDISDLKHKDWEQRSDYEDKRLNHNMNYFHETRSIYQSLDQIIKKLRSNNKYQMYHYLIPEMDTMLTRRSQMYSDYY